MLWLHTSRSFWLGGVLLLPLLLGNKGGCTDPNTTPCTPKECGPRPGAPNFMCSDGSVGGPGACERQADATCGYSWHECGGGSTGGTSDAGPQTCGTRGGVVCDSTQFCNFEPDTNCGATDRGGVCEPIPAGCSKEYSPVCGCDGKTYDNACSAHAAGVSVRSQDTCRGGSGKGCGGFANVRCEPGEFCDYEEAAGGPGCDGTYADLPGVCHEASAACPDLWKPVCGCDRKTYSNTCDAHAQGLSVWHDGACTELDCKAVGGRAVDGIGPGPECDKGEANYTSLVYSNGNMSVEGTACCVPTESRWFATCGDPGACRGFDPKIPLCSAQAEGVACVGARTECAIPDDVCNRHLRCASYDPAEVCPISRATQKENISYLDDTALAAYHDQVVGLRLAHYNYTADNKREEHLGFIIEDAEPASYVEEGRGRVDLYAYTSAVVAAIKVQDKRIQELEQELRTLRAELHRKH